LEFLQLNHPCISNYLKIITHPLNYFMSDFKIHIHSYLRFKSAFFSVLFLSISVFSYGQQPVKVACVGNSITWGHGIKDRNRNTYPAQLQLLLGKGFEVRNFGNNGKCAQDDSDDPYTKTQEYRDALAFNPDIVIIKLGTNDSKPQNWKDAKRFSKSLEKIAVTFNKLPSHPRIIIAQPATAFSRSWNINDSIISNAILPVVEKMATKHKWQLVDLHTATASLSRLFPDGIHPNEEGALIIAKNIRDAIREDSHRPQVTLFTDQGKIVVELFNETPLHRDNFLRQVKAGTYNGVLWHRVINDFIIQTGDRLSKKAKPGEMLGEGDEKSSDWIPAEFRAPLYFHQRGMLNAAREGDDTNPEQKSSSTQFTIVTGKIQNDQQLDNCQRRIDEWSHQGFKLTQEMRETYKQIGGAAHLDGSYTVFGRVVSGMDVVEKIEQAKVDKNDRPIHDYRIKKAKITKK